MSGWTYRVDRIEVPGWTLPEQPKLLLAQLRATYAALDRDDGRILHAPDGAYVETLCSVIAAQAEHRADVAVFPEFAWPVAAADRARAALDQHLAADTACVLPFEHATIDQARAIADRFPLSPDVRASFERELRVAGEPARGIANLCITAIRAGNGLVAVPQLKLRPAGLEEEQPLGHWRFAPGHVRRILVGGERAMAVAICFDFLAIDPVARVRLRDHVTAANLVVVPECNPAPLHAMYARAVLGLLDTVARRPPPVLAFANVAAGTQLPRYPKQPYFGFSRVIGALGTTSPPIEHAFSVIEGSVVAHAGPESLRALHAPPTERLSLHGVSWAVFRAQESLIATRVPLAGPQLDPAYGRTATQIEVFRRVPCASPWRQIHATPSRRAVLDAHGIGHTLAHQVPAELVPAGGLVGADSRATALDEALAQPYPIWVCGAGGTGKSALVAAALAQRPWCRVLWLDMEQVEHREQLGETLLWLLGIVRGFELGPEEQWQLVMRELVAAPTALVLDSFERSAATIPAELLAQPWPLRLIVTARKLPTDETIPLTPVEVGFSDEDARALLARISGRRDIPKHIVDATTGSPLACVWVGTMLKLGVDPPSFTSLQELLAARLREASPTQWRMLAALCALPAPLRDVDLAQICGLTPAQIEDGMRMFERLALVAREGTPALNRIRHPFVRQFVPDPGDLLAGRIAWATDLITSFGGDANWRLYPTLSRHWPNIRHILLDLAKRGDARFLSLWRAVDYFLWASGRWSDRIAMGSRAIELARSSGSTRHLVHAIYDSIGETRYYRDHNLGAVLASIRDAVEALGTPDGRDAEIQAGFVAYYASRWLRQAWPAGARAAAQHALRVARALGLRRLEGLAHHSLAYLERVLDKRRDELEQARALFEGVHDHEMAAVACRDLGRIHLAEARWGDALVELDRALDTLRELQLPTYEAIVAGDHALALAKLGDVEEAQRELDDAIAVTTAIGSAFRLRHLEKRRRQLAEIAASHRGQ